jgi:hypothetical protein
MVSAGTFSSGALSFSPTSTETALREESANSSERGQNVIACV